MGISLFEYNEMTPFELNVCVETFTEKLKNEQETEMFYAYLGAYWQRVETLKSFNEMIGKETEQKQMTAEEMLTKVMGFNSELGGVVV